ncbi:SDR family oxidoreductase [Flammeovirgaceae bacterium SG7u.111]|nr:SDR family oxidoreductase [Flammeovirgaceae bacterium SG7u.132]WPO36186.1 SDR family oxidoreductase [Flammeovirgaceae bacterium SG7u.111]
MEEEMTISILGCGWIGLPLGAYLSSKGIKVKGSVTRTHKLKNLNENDIEPFLLKLSPKPEGDSLAHFLDTDVLIVDIPPSRAKFGGVSFYPEQMKVLTAALASSPCKKVIFVSSTSVYSNPSRVVTEEEPLAPVERNKPLIDAENHWLAQTDLRVTVLRAGGLMGYDRYPAKYFAGKKDLTKGHVPVNYIHRDDVIGIIEQVLEQEKWGEIYNLVAPEHPFREDVYVKNCIDLGMELPTFNKKNSVGYKIVSGKKVVKDLGYEFQYPDPLYFLYFN